MSVRNSFQFCLKPLKYINKRMKECDFLILYDDRMEEDFRQPLCIQSPGPVVGGQRQVQHGWSRIQSPRQANGGLHHPVP